MKMTKISRVVLSPESKKAMNASMAEARKIAVIVSSKTKQEVAQGLKKVFLEQFAANFDPKIVAKKAVK